MYSPIATSDGLSLGMSLEMNGYSYKTQCESRGETCRRLCELLLPRLLRWKGSRATQLRNFRSASESWERQPCLDLSAASAAAVGVSVGSASVAGARSRPVRTVAMSMYIIHDGQA
eukprot:6171902-Pleurochrysis_carterae.AAC.1